MTLGLTVGELRDVLADLDDDMQVVVNSIEGFCGGICSASIAHSHSEDEEVFLRLLCSDEEDDFDATIGDPPGEIEGLEEVEVASSKHVVEVKKAKTVKVKTAKVKGKSK